AIVPNDLDQIAALAPEAEQMAAQRVMLQHLLHPQRQRREPAPHVRMARRQPHPNACRDRDHRSVSSPRRIRSSASTSTSRSTMTRRPFALSTSIRLLPTTGSDEPGTVAGTSGVINAGTNPSIRMLPRLPACAN